MRRDTILIRVDGSDQIGMGHAMRCLSLARELARLASIEAIFVMRGFAMGVHWVQRQAHHVIELPADLAPEAEAAQVRALIAARHAAGVITDLRALPAGLLDAVHDAGACCAVIDEWGRRAIRATILINGTIVPAWHHYELDGEVRCYIGARFALMEPKFAALHDQPRMVRRGSSKILVALGGDDPFFLTAKVMRALERLTGLEITVVIGPAFIDAPQIRQLAEVSRHRYTVCQNISNMADLMMESDVALVGGGLIALELACVGTPGLIVCEVPHQLDTAAALEQSGAAVSLGFGVAIPEQEIAQTVSGLLTDDDRRRRMSEAGKRLIDGKGCARVARIIADALAVQGGVDESASLPIGR